MKLQMSEGNYQRLAYKGYAIGLATSALAVLGEGYFWYFDFPFITDTLYIHSGRDFQNRYRLCRPSY